MTLQTMSWEVLTAGYTYLLLTVVYANSKQLPFEIFMLNEGREGNPWTMGSRHHKRGIKNLYPILLFDKIRKPDK